MRDVIYLSDEYKPQELVEREKERKVWEWLSGWPGRCAMKTDDGWWTATDRTTMKQLHRGPFGPIYTFKG